MLIILLPYVLNEVHVLWWGMVSYTHSRDQDTYWPNGFSLHAADAKTYLTPRKLVILEKWHDFFELNWNPVPVPLPRGFIVVSASSSYGRWHVNDKDVCTLIDPRKQ